MKEECREVGGSHIIESLVLDLRYGARMLRKNLGFTVVTNVVPFPFIHHITQGYSKSFHYQGLGASWDYEKRNAFFGTFTARGVVPATAGGN